MLEGTLKPAWLRVYTLHAAITSDSAGLVSSVLEYIRQIRKGDLPPEVTGTDVYM